MEDPYSLSLPIVDLPSHELNPLPVTDTSPIALRKHTEAFARHFKHEMQYDAVQFGATESQSDVGHVPYEAYLFHESARDQWEGPDTARLFGACCFRQRESGWSLDWVWLHPYFRARGHLAKAWQGFQWRYGDNFHIEPPISCGMQQLLKKIARDRD